MALAVLLPFVACAAQWFFWDILQPYVGFLFIPAIFLSAWVGGLIGGLAATAIGTTLAWYIFIPPTFAFTLDNPASIVSVVIFVLTGCLFSFFFDQLKRSKHQVNKALSMAEFANGKISQLYQKLKEAQRLASVGNWTWDIQSGTHIWSEEVYRIYGRDPALPPAIYPEIQKYFTPESWITFSAAVERGLAQGISYECDAEIIRPPGYPRCWIAARGEAIRDNSGKIVNLQGTVQDITERKLAEEEITRLNVDLEQRVAERTAELTAANRELDTFAYAVAHDLRAPLRAMSGFSQALREDYGGQLESEALVFLDQISFASRKMSDLVDGLLILSRSTRGGLQYDVVDISTLSERLLVELAQSDPERQVTVEVEAELQARGDVRMVEVIMRNLLTNAWKYTNHVAKPSIRMYAEERENVRFFCVADNGAGFDMAHANRLFKPFQRLHRQDEFPGIGIGLATVQRIVNRHAGIIEARGEPGKGAIFCFTLSDMPADSAQDKKGI
ncbi:PAS domain-containing sensor histidine kinase [Candidatus Nitrotoga sp. HW29]|uniref:PAS domain-containing sensor histidine kinase n=1 Tax=Candidatus Nitrotoga sp. HW29 TaxID=2886963 RepID=UPI001EF16E8D|nr:PAS domain-containing sensor histidine kinase [Candidatus Nitrotoga sp. HW29]